MSNLMERFKHIRRRCGLSQTTIADAMNTKFGTNYTKAAISNYESGTSPASVGRCIDLLKCTGSEVSIIIQERVNAKFEAAISKMEASDREKIMRYISDLRVSSLSNYLETNEINIEELETRMYLNNYINKFVDVINKKSGFTLLFLESQSTGKFDYQIK